MRRKIINIILFCFGIFTGIILFILFNFYNTNKSENSNTNLNDAIKKIESATVAVETFTNNEMQYLGSGFVFAKNDKYGFILTNSHVVEKAGDVKIKFNNNKLVDAKIVKSNSYYDLAILSVPVDNIISVATLGNSDKLNVGDEIFTVGTPCEETYYNSVTSGIISGLNRKVSANVYKNGDETTIMNVIQFDASINIGNSGGPLCNIKGEVIGINTMKIAEEYVESISFAIPINDALDYVKNVLNI